MGIFGAVKTKVSDFKETTHGKFENIRLIGGKIEAALDDVKFLFEEEKIEHLEGYIQHLEHAISYDKPAEKQFRAEIDLTREKIAKLQDAKRVITKKRLEKQGVEI